MSSFDIQDLLSFQPARALCQKCKGLLKGIPGYNQQQIQCPICSVRYDVRGRYPREEFHAYLKKQGLYLEDRREKIFDRSLRLASIASSLQHSSPDYPPMRGLLQGLNQAQDFVHFTTFGISHIMFGALKMTAQRVSVQSSPCGDRIH